MKTISARPVAHFVADITTRSLLQNNRGLGVETDYVHFSWF